MKRLRFSTVKRLWHVLPEIGLHEPSSLIDRALVAEIVSDGSRNRLSVCFTGHRHLARKDVPALSAQLDNLLEVCYSRGYRDFYCGGALGFDMLAASCVKALQRRHAGVRLILAIPCSDQARRWTGADIAAYERLLYAADDIRVLSPFYYDGCMLVRNRYMVDHSSLCICYLRHPKGGTASTVAYAVTQGLPVLNVAMENACAAFCAD